VTGPAGAPEPGDIRLGRNGVVEMYDGRHWVPYERKSGDDPGPLVREVGDDGPERTASDRDTGPAS